MRPVQEWAPGRGTDAFVTTLDLTGSSVLFSTYLGGTRDDVATGVAVRPTGEVIVAGATSSGDFPDTVGGPAPQATAFVADLDPARAVLRSSAALRLGSGADAVALDAGGLAHVTGRSYVAAVEAESGRVVLERSLNGKGRGVAVDEAGATVVAGVADGGDEAFVFVEKLRPDFGESLYRTLVPVGSVLIERVHSGAIGLDEDGNCYVPYAVDYGVERFLGSLVRVNPEGRVNYWIALASGLHGAAVSRSGEVAAVGWAYSAGFPYKTVNALQPSPRGGTDGFVSRLRLGTSPEAPPVVERVERRPKRNVPNAFRTFILGSNFQPGALVFTDGETLPREAFKVKNDGTIVGKHDVLEGTSTIRVANPDGGEATFEVAL